MTKSYFSEIHSWVLPEVAFTASLEEMARDGASGNEGVMLWLGQQRQGIAEITHLVALRGNGVIKEPYFLQIESGLLNDVADLAIEYGVSLIGQIHSHGGGCSTDLSLTDRRYGIKTPYYLSVVAPDFALRQETRITDCGVHVYEPNHAYRRLSDAETAERIKVVRGLTPTMLLIGE